MEVALLNILVVNSGSSSLKVSWFGKERRDMQLKGVKCMQGLEGIFASLPVTDVRAVGHRFVHGGSQYRASVRMNDQEIADLNKVKELAPLHNTACLEGIQIARKRFPDIPQVAVFDTAFHANMPLVAAQYALDPKYGIRRYGFHGISNAFICQAYAQHVKNQHYKIVTMHLGNGCSMTAVRDGASLDTSMGFTPADGLVMGTRAGDIDAAVVEYLCRRKEIAPAEVMNLLNHASGLLGVSGSTSDMAELLTLTNSRANAAIDLFCYRIVKYLGAYTAVLEGVDAYIFSGGIGENAPRIRAKIIADMKWLGAQLDEEANLNAVGLNAGEIKKISTDSSAINIYVIATDENAFIAQETVSLL